MLVFRRGRSRVPEKVDLAAVEVRRKFTGRARIPVMVIAVALSLFQLYTALFGVFRTSVVHRAVHLALVLVVFFLLYPASRKKPYGKSCLWADAVMAALALVIVGYVAVSYEAVANRIGALQDLTRADLVMGVLVILLVLEACRRFSPLFLGICLLSLVYMVAGPYLPGMLSHRGISLERLIYLVSYSPEGIFGTGLAVSSTYLYMFILFGAFLERTGVADFFIQFALSAVGRFTGGPAKAAVISSSLMGTVMGSSIANVAVTGAFTIPLMKRTGFRPHVAGAVECVSSTGGQLVPPVMGAAAFIMAEITGIPYAKICLAALVPSFLYYLSAFLVVHFEAARAGLRGLGGGEVPRFSEVMLSSGYMLLPLLVLVYLLLFSGYTPTKAAVVAIAAAIAVSWVKKSTRMGWRQFLEALEKGAYSAVEICALCAAIGIVIGAVTLTGLGMRFATIALAISGGQLIPLLLMSMVVCLILGTGLPTPAAYLVMAMFACPALEAVGLPVISAHLFSFWYALVSGVTPPVAVVAVVAAGIAQADFMKTALTAFRFAAAGFVIPFMFVLGPELLLMGTATQVAQAIVTASLGTLALAACVQGYLLREAGSLERFLLLVASLGLIKPGTLTDLAGVVSLLLVFWLQWRKRVKGGGEPVALPKTGEMEGKTL